jgi:hypothetical protein
MVYCPRVYDPASSKITSPFPSLFLPGILVFPDELLLAFLPCLPGALTKSGRCDTEPLETCEDEPFWAYEAEPLGKYGVEPFGRCDIESFEACEGWFFRIVGR